MINTPPAKAYCGRCGYGCLGRRCSGSECCLISHGVHGLPLLLIVLFSARDQGQPAALPPGASSPPWC